VLTHEDEETGPELMKEFRPTADVSPSADAGG
jgi:hypothetical protein